jgi:D-sedoheptulose 7-phosphate isomerase
MDNIKLINESITDSIDTQRRILLDDTLRNSILIASQKITEAYQKGKKTILAGNGGSASGAEHMAGEFIGKYYLDRSSMPAIALSANTVVITAVGNDYEFAEIFSRQIQAFGERGDIFIGLSTSGNSKNIIAALKECNKRKIFSIGLTGNNPCRMDKICDLIIKVPSGDTPRVQESHIMIGHIICQIVEKNLFGRKG